MTSSELYAILAGLFIGFVTIAILVGIVIKQRQTIKDFENPKYGFLGKKLSAYLLGVTALGVSGIILFPNNINTRDYSISVSDSQYQISIDITAEKLFEETNEYLITLTPSFDGEVWGRSDEIFLVYWEVNDEPLYQYISYQEQDGFIRTLDNGTNIIRGTISIAEQTLTKEIIVEVD